jgi:hypothetical protein
MQHCLYLRRNGVDAIVAVGDGDNGARVWAAKLQTLDQSRAGGRGIAEVNHCAAEASVLVLGELPVDDREALISMAPKKPKESQLGRRIDFD